MRKHCKFGFRKGTNKCRKHPKRRKRHSFLGRARRRRRRR